MSLKRYGFLLFIILLPALAQAQNSASPQLLRIAAARSAADSGLINYLAEEFRKQTPDTSIEIHPVGALQALDLGRQGEVDLVITHHPQNESLFMEERHGLERAQFMYGEYALFGPVGLLQKFSTFTNIAQVMHEIAAREYPFMVPSPRSGTYRKIEELWALAGIDPDWVGYENSGTSSAATLLQSQQFSALTIADLSIYYTNREQLTGDIAPLYRGDIVLRNPFHAIVVNATTHPNVNEKQAIAFLDFLVSDAGQDAIRTFTQNKFSAAIFTPSAHLDRGLLARKAEQALKRQSKWLHMMLTLVATLLVMLILLIVFGIRLRKVQQHHMAHELEIKQSQYDRDLAIQSNQIKDEFISVVSHELRTPLTSIIGSLGLLQNQFNDANSSERKLLDLASRNSERLLLVINDLLDIEKMESGSLHLEMLPLRLHSLIEEALALNTSYADKYSVSYRFENPQEDIYVRGDKDRLMQVITNLLSNAAKFAPENSEILIRCQRKNDTVRVSILDQGPGVADEYKQKVFEKFTQVDASTRREKGGTGLGLAISRALIRLHKGNIGVEDNLPQGSIFYFELPIETH
jgi:signal transduction histidine kinase/DNA-binding transcriptional LysR family regulator